MTTAVPRTLSDYPLWRLLVMLDDAERLVGLDSDSTRAIAAAVQRKLRNLQPAPNPDARREDRQ